jgi:hypothetical protein
MLEDGALPAMINWNVTLSPETTGGRKDGNSAQY